MRPGNDFFATGRLGQLQKLALHGSVYIAHRGYSLLPNTTSSPPTIKSSRHQLIRSLFFLLDIIKAI